MKEEFGKRPPRFETAADAYKYLLSLPQEEQDRFCELADDQVHDLKDQEAADINNGGLREQLDYIFHCGVDAGTMWEIFFETWRDGGE